LPVLEEVLANLECPLVNSYGGGDHTIFVGEVEKATLNDGAPLLHWPGKLSENKN
jgi:flavin reductase (DIM6/NTAB) family NADH-FMN oxidoreductase RutF